MVEMFDLEAVGKNVKEARMKAGVSQQKMALKIGYQNASAISEFENGKKLPDLERLVSIAKVLNITPFEMLDPDYPNHDANEVYELRAAVARLQFEVEQLRIAITELTVELKRPH